MWPSCIAIRQMAEDHSINKSFAERRGQLFIRVVLIPRPSHYSCLFLWLRSIICDASTTVLYLVLLTPLTIGSNHSSSPIRDRAWIAFPNASTQQGGTTVQDQQHSYMFLQQLRQGDKTSPISGWIVPQNVPVY